MDHQNKKFHVESIEQEMWQKAQEIWGIKGPTSLTAFDPLIKMLIGAQAVEIKKIQDEIESSQTRVLQKLAQFMMPEILTGPIPASSILHVQPYDPICTITPDLQASSMKDDTEIQFSPAGYYEIMDARIEYCYLLLRNSLIDIGGRTDPDKTVSQTETLDFQSKEQLQISSARSLLIGVDVSDSISHLDNISFFIDWINISKEENEEYCRLLQSTRWFLNGEPIKARSGIERKKISEDDEQLNEFEKKYDIAAILEDRVNTFYRNHFITVHVQKVIENSKKTHPDSIAHLLQNQKITFSRPLLWFEVYFPANYSDKRLRENLTVQVNCMPVMNRRLHSNVYAIDSNKVSILPLKTDEQFLAIKDVRDSHGQIYRNIPSFRSKDSQAGFYYMRHGGVDRIDTRQASELLQNLMELIRDESATFSAFSPDEMMTDLKELNQIVSRLEKNINRYDQNRYPIWYLIINPFENKSITYEELTVQYWTTMGKLGNDIPNGEINRVSSIHLGPAICEVSNLVSSGHGRDQLNETDILSAYRNALLTRNRIVTAEDIKSICRSYLSNQISEVEIKRGVIVDFAPKQGLSRSIDVILTPAKSSRLDEKEWQKICSELHVILENQWMNGWPLRVKIQRKSEGENID